MENSNNRDNRSQSGESRDSHRNFSDREFYNNEDRNPEINADGYGGDEANRQNKPTHSDTGDEYSNTSTGSRYSASKRKEDFEDPEYGATAQRTANDVMGNDEENEKN